MDSEELEAARMNRRIRLLLIRSAAGKVSPGEMMPDRSARQLRQDAQLMKDQVK